MNINDVQEIYIWCLWAIIILVFFLLVRGAMSRQRIRTQQEIEAAEKAYLAQEDARARGYRVQTSQKSELK